MLSQDLIVARTEGRPPALIEGSGRKARDRIEHFLRAAIDNDNTRRAYGRALGSFFAFWRTAASPRTSRTVARWRRRIRWRLRLTKW
jgi:hypothetical protein